MTAADARPRFAFNNEIALLKSNRRRRATKVDQVRIGVLGAGAMGAMHAAHLAAAPGARLAAVAAEHVTVPVAETAARGV